MTEFNIDLERSSLMSRHICERRDIVVREVIEQYKGLLQFEPIAEYCISESAWKYALSLSLEARYVFAHPTLLREHPMVSLYYRGLSLLSLKQVARRAVQVKNWEQDGYTGRPSGEACSKVACLYNEVISHILDVTSGWRLEDGHRSILATIGISLDGQFRNKIGAMAESLVKRRVLTWLSANELVEAIDMTTNEHQLPDGVTMKFGTEPDIEFIKDGRTIATVEVKGGRDPAGALERLGAMSKSFAETPAGCTNFLIVGVMTSEMKRRLDEIGTVKVFALDDVAQGGYRWHEFTNELFLHAVRILPQASGMWKHGVAQK